MASLEDVNQDVDQVDLSSTWLEISGFLSYYDVIEAFTS